MSEIYETPQAKSRPNRSFSKIWILPVVAALVGVGMVFNEWRNKGIDIEVTFNTAEGLVADKTLVKYKNVDIGLLNEVRFSDDHESIIVKIEIEKEMRGLLKPDSNFWVVRPRVGAGGVSGIGTLLSGAYIQLSRGKEDGFKKNFVGLETPPITPINAEGLHLALQSSGGKPVSVGSPVVYRGFKVGKVESFLFDAKERVATYGVFIHSPYDSLVTTNSIFWNSGGISVTANAEGVKVDMSSLETLIGGGIEFGVPDELPLGEQVAAGATFKLYGSPKGLNQSRTYKFFEYLVLVEDSIGGLNVGAPVEYLGIRIGTVAKPFLKLDTKLEGVDNLQSDPRIPILVKIEPARVFSQAGADLDAFVTELEDGMLRGLTASVESANLLTGSLKVSLKFGGEPISELERYGPYKVIPARHSGIAAITDQIQNLLSTVQSLPIDETVTRANKALKTADETLSSLKKTMAELQNTLEGVQPDSEAYQALSTSLDELKTTLKNVQPLVKDLSDQPNSLIFGKENKPDAEPKAAGGKDD